MTKAAVGSIYEMIGSQVGRVSDGKQLPDSMGNQASLARVNTARERMFTHDTCTDEVQPVQEKAKLCS